MSSRMKTNTEDIVLKLMAWWGASELALSAHRRACNRRDCGTHRVDCGVEALEAEVVSARNACRVRAKALATKAKMNIRDRANRRA